MASLKIESLSKTFGGISAVAGVTLDVNDGEFLALLGPSGCGKTTTLRMIAGFTLPTKGVVKLADKDVTRLPPWRRNTGMVFQSYALFPHLTAAQNVAFGLEMRKVTPQETVRRVAESLQLVRLEGYEDRLPREMSGGQQQRVALARALAIRPDVLLLDEPLSNLDAKLREVVRVEIRQLQQSLGLTTILVTHDQDEALAMADRLVVMEHGVVRQVGTPRDLYERPENRFVADFVGRSSFLEGQLESSGVFKTPGGLCISCEAAWSGPAVLSLRPERAEVGPFSSSLENRFRGVVEFVSYLGAVVHIHVRLSPTDVILVTQTNRSGRGGTFVGETIEVGWKASCSSVFRRE